MFLRIMIPFELKYSFDIKIEWLMRLGSATISEISIFLGLSLIVTLFPAYKMVTILGSS